MTLQSKVLSLKVEGATAIRHALWWEKVIREHGEEKATAFYTHLGLNHLEKKSIDWEGLTLSREPTEAEKIAVKGIHQSQESAKEQIGRILLDLRLVLIDDGLKQIAKLPPSEYHALILEAPKESHDELRDRLSLVHRQGRQLVANELGRKDALPDYDDDELDMLTDLTDARIANEVQSRIGAAAAKFRQMGLTGQALMDAITDEITGGTVSYIDRASIGLGNKVISMGRGYEAQRRSDDWNKITYSAILDQNTCPACAAADGEESTDGSDLEPVPNISCDGSDYCRCFWVYVYDQSFN